MDRESGQAAVEWIALLLVVSLSLGAAAAAVPSGDGRSLGGFLAHRIACAAKGGCDDGDAALARAYGPRDAALVRANAPGLVYERGERALPVDWRRCRARSCADAPDDRDLDVHRSDAGQPATAFTRVIRRGARTYVQYWLYYPDSNTTWAGSDWIWRRSPGLRVASSLVRGSSRYPGFHADDWEGLHTRLDPDGSVWVRATAHGHYQGCKYRSCRNRWMRATGWTRVSRGSHAGHIPVRALRRWPIVSRRPWPPWRRRHRPAYPGRDLHERTTTAEGLRLIPLETIDRRRYRPLDAGVKPPWRKDAYRQPESDSS